MVTRAQLATSLGFEIEPGADSGELPTSINSWLNELVEMGWLVKREVTKPGTRWSRCLEIELPERRVPNRPMEVRKDGNTPSVIEHCHGARRRPGSPARRHPRPRRGTEARAEHDALSPGRRPHRIFFLGPRDSVAPEGPGPYVPTGLGPRSLKQQADARGARLIDTAPRAGTGGDQSPGDGRRQTAQVTARNGGERRASEKGGGPGPEPGPPSPLAVLAQAFERRFRRPPAIDPAKWGPLLRRALARLDRYADRGQGRPGAGLELGLQLLAATDPDEAPRSLAYYVVALDGIGKEWRHADRHRRGACDGAHCRYREGGRPPRRVRPRANRRRESP
jgi:hypothetical protein